jgi:putative transposase
VSTELFARDRRREQAVVWAVMDRIINSISTRRIAVITEQLGGETLSESVVSMFEQ